MIEAGVLLATHTDTLEAELADVLLGLETCVVTRLHDFDSVIAELLFRPYHLVLIEAHLGGMSGLDLLAGRERLHLSVPVVVVDTSMEAQTAVNALRLGAIDYFCPPFKPELILQRISRAIDVSRIRIPSLATTFPRHESTEIPDRSPWLHPGQRHALFLLRQPDFQAIEEVLTQLQTQTGVDFAGVLDSAHNVLSAVGKLSHGHLLNLRRVLAVNESAELLAQLLHEDHFTHRFFEGTQRCIHINTANRGHRVFIVTIGSAEIKPGLLRLWLQRTASKIQAILENAARSIQ